MTIWLITIIHSTTDSKHKAFPKWMESSGFQLTTSSNEFNQVITVLLKTSMFLAGAIGCFLDNTVPGKKCNLLTNWYFTIYLHRFLKPSITHIFTLPGTDEERGIIKWNAQFKSKDSENEKSKDETDTYDIPLCMGLLRR